jgi:ADP-heptose:LPS heptosyltransferase/GT2 family glycosyltransferase
MAVTGKGDFLALGPSLRSLQAQAYQKWELCISCAQELHAQIQEYIVTIGLENSLVKIDVQDYRTREEAWNHLLKRASGDLVALLDPGDFLQPHALFETVYLFNLHDYDLIYSDDDQITPGKKRVNPFFKPDWSPDLFFSMNYLRRLWVARKPLVQEIGGFRIPYAPAGEYDLLLRLTEKTQKIGHVKTVLYSKAQESEGDLDSGSPQELQALADCLVRRGIKGEVLAGEYPGTFRVKRALTGQHFISIIIPTKFANFQCFQDCLNSIINKSTYQNYEIILIDTSRKEDKTIQKFLKTVPLKVITWDKPFNWSQVNNVGATYAQGDYLLFLNDDVEVITPDWLEALLEHAQRPEVAAVGGKLLFPDGLQQHAGAFLVDHGGGGRHAFRGLSSRDPGYFGLASVQRNCAYVTGACFMTRRDIFEKMGGFDELLSLVNNETDFCLRSIKAGYLVVFTPYALLYHYEKMSRKDMEEEEDIQLFWERWRPLLEGGDPYYNPNLTLERSDFGINEELIITTIMPCSTIDLQRIRRILVVKLDHLGDVILSFPAIHRLRQIFPQAKITALVGSWAQSLTQMHPAVDEVLTYDFFQSQSLIPHKILTNQEKKDVAAWLRQFEFDLAIDLRRHPETREFLQLSGAEISVGFAQRNEFPWLSLALPGDPETSLVRARRHIAQDFYNLMEMIAIAGGDTFYPRLELSDQDQDLARQHLFAKLPPDSQVIIGISPGAGSPFKCWPSDYYARLVDIFVERLEATVIFFGIQQERPLIESILKQMKNAQRAISMAGKLNINQFLFFLKNIDLFIGNNSGPIHMAAALEIPTLCINMAHIDPREWGPIAPNAAVIYMEKLCSPCYLGRVEHCPHDTLCLRRLHVEKVWEAALRMLLPRWPKLGLAANAARQAH